MTSLDPKRWERAQQILLAALDLPESQRPAYVRKECGADEALRVEVFSLLEADSNAGAFFEDLAGRAGLEAEGLGDGDEAGSKDMAGRRIGAWRLERSIGHGGMGTVYLAERADGSFEQRAALKLLSMGAHHPAAHRRFLAERRILARLEHPHIAHLLDGGVTEDGTPYFVMEFVEGVPLTRYCDAHKLDVDQRLRLFLNVCDAVAFAHRSLVVHRDLKPSNILVDDDGRVKLLDFGIAKLLSDDDTEAMTRPAERMMTPAYASPEQLQGEPITTASDVYSLGVLLYELLTGLSPYDLEQGTTSMLEAVCKKPVTGPSTRLRRLPTRTQEPTDTTNLADARRTSLPSLRRRLKGDLDRIVLMALRKEPRRRYASVAELGEDVRRHLDGFPVRARGEGTLYAASRFVGRHKVGVFATATVVVLLAALALVATRFAVITSRQSQQIAQERDKAEEVSQFLEGLFTLADPTMTDGESVPARELLDRGAQQVRTKFSSRPAVKASMMAILGEVYQGLGLHDSARDLFEGALVLLRNESNASPGEIAQTLQYLGIVAREQGDMERAHEVLQEALATQLEEFGSEHRSVAITRHHLGLTLHHTGDMMGSKEQFELAVDTLRNLDSREDEEYSQALYFLAEFLNVTGEREEVLPLYEESLEVLERIHGRQHPDVPPILRGMAWFHAKTGDRDSAEPMLREALEIDRLLYRQGNSVEPTPLGTSAMSMGKFLLEGDRIEEAEPFFHEAIAVFERSPDPEPNMYGLSLSALANCLAKQEKLDEAERLLRRATTLFRKTHGTGSLMEANALVDLAKVLRNAQRPREARPLLDEALISYRKMLPEKHYRIEQALAVLEEVQGP